MSHKKVLFISLLLFGTCLFAQTPDSLYVEIDSSKVFISTNEIQNTYVLLPFFQKLDSLKTDKKKKINIVHIGDSHIQADIFSGRIRKNLQQFFGNGGRGFVFPHRLAKTNGSMDAQFSSTISWESLRNIYPNEGKPVGLSGFALFTSVNSFVMEMTIKQKENYFNTLKIITPQNKSMFKVATATKTIIVEREEHKKVTHTIKRGESLSVIAEKYDVSISEIKNANGLKSNVIRAGSSLQIPTNEKVKKSVENSEFIKLDLIQNKNYHSYYNEISQNKIYFLPNKEVSEYALNGLVLENDQSGIIYHSIGVNGAKCSDFTNYPMFFDQLSVLNPDLIIVSLGTNESFDKLESSVYKVQLNLFLNEVRKANQNATIIIMTPPPSLFKRKFPNTLVADYAKEIIQQAQEKSTAVWDLFSIMGGLFGVESNHKSGIISVDRVHYTLSGYEKQGELFTDALLKAYTLYKLEKE